MVSSKPLSRDSLSSSTNLGLLLDDAFVWLTRLFAIGIVGVLGAVCFVIGQYALPAAQKFGFSFLMTREWNIDEQVFGSLPFVYGTLVSSTIAFIIAIPVGITVSIATSEDFLPPQIRTPLAFLVEMIAAIPSVLIGFWGIFYMLPAINPLQKLLHSALGWVPLFGTEPTGSGAGMFAAGLILAVMILPTVSAISRDVLLAVPATLRSASMALGATRWETIFRVILPAAFSGIVGASMLALGRALGETIAVVMVIGNSIEIKASLLEPGYTIPAVLANQFPEALDDLHVGALMFLALILFVVTLTVNIAAMLLVQLAAQNK